MYPLENFATDIISHSDNLIKTKNIRKKCFDNDFARYNVDDVASARFDEL